MNLLLRSRRNPYLLCALSLLPSSCFLIARFDILRTLREANARKEIVVENVSGPERTAVHLGSLRQTYVLLALSDFAAGPWAIGKLPGSAQDVLTSTQPGDRLRVVIPIAGSTQFVFVKSPDSGKVRITDLETGRVSELALQASSNYTVTLSTVSGTRRGWDLFLASLLLFIATTTLAAMALTGWRNGIRVWADVGQSPVSYAIIALTLLLNNLFMAHRLFFYGDSQSYWDSGRTFVQGGVFSFANVQMPVSFRGYLLPFVAFVAQGLGEALGLEAVLVYVLLMAVIYSLFFVFTVPSSIRWLTGMDAKPYQVLVVFGLTGFFWMGWFTWLLSDLLAMCAWLAGLVLLLDGIQGQKRLTLVSAGMFMGMAINCRPSYALGLVASSGLILYYLFKDRPSPKTTLAGLARSFCRVAAPHALGLLLISLPQAEINWRRFEKVSLFPFASSNPHPRGFETHGTFVEYSLAYGRLRTQGWPSPRPNRVGMSTLYRHFGIDPVALDDYHAAGKMLERHGGMSVPLYLELMREYPLEFAVDFFLKTFTGLNNQSFEPYPVSWLAGPPVALFTFFNYCVLFLAMLLLGLRLVEGLRGWQASPRLSLWYLTLAMPALAYVPLFVEWRYFLPVYMGMYLLLVTTSRSTYEGLLRERSLPVWFVLFVLTCFALSALVTPEYLY